MKLIYARTGDIVEVNEQKLTAEKNTVVQIDSSAKQFDATGNEITMYIELDEIETLKGQ